MLTGLLHYGLSALVRFALGDPGLCSPFDKLGAGFNPGGYFMTGFQAFDLLRTRRQPWRLMREITDLGD